MAESKLVPMSSYLTTDNTKKYLESILGNKTQSFITTLSSMVGSNANLNACDRASLLGCALKATSMDLPFDQNLGFAWCIPYGNKAQFQMGYKGYIQLGLRSSQIVKLNAKEVLEGEYKGFDEIGEPIIEWLPLEERKDKAVVGYMAGIKLINGFTKVVFWSIADIEKHATKYSQAYRYAKKNNQKDAVWIENFDAMAKKTVLKDLISKYAPMSVEMQQAIKFDQAVILSDPETGVEIVDYVDNPEVIETEETLSKEQIQNIAKIIGSDEKKLDVILNMGYNTINEIPASKYEEIIKEIK